MRTGDALTFIIPLAVCGLLASGAATGRGSDWSDHRADDELRGRPACSGSASSAAKACADGAKGDYWLGIGKCQNLSDLGQRAECVEEAGEGLREERELCEEQHHARLDICDALGEAPYDPQIDPTQFVEGIDNPYLPYVPGTTWIYEGETEEGLERIVVQVTDDTREVMGVACTVVRDTVYLEGDVIEDTFDWYAQDVHGNVWYFGELSYEWEDGVIVSLEGSWEAGVDGAKPGIVMQATPRVGDVYRQEFLLGEAEDMGQVAGLDESVSVPYGDFDGCVGTRDFLPISPDAVELKFYAPGVGLVLEVNPETGERVELVERSAP